MKEPNSEQVAVAWLNYLPNLDAPAATNLPDGTGWSATGFVVASVVGDASLPDVPRSVPIIGCDAWAVTPGASKPPYNHAAGIAQIIRQTAIMWTGPVSLSVGAGYAPVIVQGAQPMSEIRRVPDPDTSRAHYSVDVALSWVRVPD